MPGHLKLGRKAWIPMTAGHEYRGIVPSLKLTAKAPENRPSPKRKGSSPNHHFSGAMLVLGSVAVQLMSYSSFQV